MLMPLAVVCVVVMEGPCTGRPLRAVMGLTPVFAGDPATASAFGKSAAQEPRAARKRPNRSPNPAHIANSRSHSITAARIGGAANSMTPAVIAASQSTAQSAGATPAPKLINQTSKAPTRPFRAMRARRGGLIDSDSPAAVRVIPSRTGTRSAGRFAIGGQRQRPVDRGAAQDEARDRTAQRRDRRPRAEPE